VSIAQRRPRWRWLAISATVLASVLTAALVARLTMFRDQARTVPIDMARDRFRSDTTTVATASTDGPGTPISNPPPPGGAPTTSAAPRTTPDSSVAQLPELVTAGVYRYHTTGEESIDALDGATHHYPDETAITVTPDGCGVLLRWDALVERRDEWRLCATPAGLVLHTVGMQYHEFFGQPEAEDVVCDQAVVVVPATPAATSPIPVQQSCTLADDTWLPTWEVLERGQRSINGESVDVGHIKMTIDDDDEYWEHTVVDWYLADDGLPVEVTATKESRSPSPIGAVVYRETYRLALASTTPLN
jgi:hypothetical protein